MDNRVLELTLDELVKKYCIQNEYEYKLLKEGKDFIDSSLKLNDEKSKIRIGSTLIEYTLYKINGGK